MTHIAHYATLIIAKNDHEFLLMNKTIKKNNESCRLMEISFRIQLYNRPNSLPIPKIPFSTSKTFFKK